MTGRDFSLEDAHGIGSLSEAEGKFSTFKCYYWLIKPSVENPQKTLRAYQPA
jgi:hypothetical protein